jgi:bifunctional DNA-binding transcriptional regulator/antitoxin component of YhaV-PrlF toxin-antitoxin module
MLARLAFRRWRSSRSSELRARSPPRWVAEVVRVRRRIGIAAGEPLSAIRTGAGRRLILVPADSEVSGRHGVPVRPWPKQTAPNRAVAAVAPRGRAVPRSAVAERRARDSSHLDLGRSRGSRSRGRARPLARDVVAPIDAPFDRANVDGLRCAPSIPWARARPPEELALNAEVIACGHSPLSR